MQRWFNTHALPEIAAKQHHASTPQQAGAPAASGALANSTLDEARDFLEALQNEEQIILNGRMRDQEWAAQSTQILDVLPKLERSVVEMEKEKHGYLLTGDSTFLDAYKRASSWFFSYHGYLSVLVANNPEQAAALKEIRSAVERWINTAALPEMEAKRARRDAAAAPVSEAGETLMRDIREKVSAFEKNELDVYQVRAMAASRQRVIKISALSALCVFAVVLLLVSNSYSCVLVRRQLSKLEGVETRIKSIIQNILDGMITVDEQGVICSMNPAAEKDVRLHR